MINKNFLILGAASVFVLAVIATPNVFAGSDEGGFPSVANPNDIILQDNGFSLDAFDVDTNAGVNEPHIAVNPLDPTNVAVASVGNLLKLSTDTGATFPTMVSPVMPVSLVNIEGYFFCGDPSLTFDSQGRLFWSYLACSFSNGNLLDLSIVVVQVNPLTGATVGSATDITPGINHDDKNWIIADGNPLSPFADNLYIVWTDFGTGMVTFSMSTDQGVNWTPNQAVSAAGEGFVWPPHITTATNGDVYVNYPTNACAGTGVSSTIQVLRDTNGGTQLAAGAGFQKTTGFAAGGADITCNVQTAPTTITIPGSVSWMQGSQAAYTIADPLVAGKIYLIGNDDPNDDFTSGDQADVVMTTSLDNGMNWGAPVTISTDQTGAFQVMPTGAIDEFGNIAVTWYDSRSGNVNGAGNNMLDLYGTFSTDGGLTFAPEFVVSDVQFDPDLGAPQRFEGPPPTLRIGEYNGIAVQKCLAYTVWTGNDGNNHEIYFDTFAATEICEAVNEDLFVSAENSKFRNHFAGPQVVEVVVIDSDIENINVAKDEPNVTVNGKILRMVQGGDGNWYGYFAEVDQALIADSTTTTTGHGLDFGVFCSNSNSSLLGPSVDLSDTVGVVLVNSGLVSNELVVGTNPPQSLLGLADCTNPLPATSPTRQMTVLREWKTANSIVPGGSSPHLSGQIGIYDGFWPFIQLFNFTSPQNVVINYNKEGNNQRTILFFSRDALSTQVSFDRDSFPIKGDVQLTITDHQLNIDSTDEDSWTFGTNSEFVSGTSTNYLVFDENGQQLGDAVSGGTIDIQDDLNDLMFGQNGVLIIDPDSDNTGTPVITLQDNDNNQLTPITQNPLLVQTQGNFDSGFGMGPGEMPVTLTETGPNTGMFVSFDESSVSNIKVTDDAITQSNATIQYDNLNSITVDFDSGILEIESVEGIWKSGDEISVSLIDSDANKNTQIDEDLDLFDSNVDSIPTLITGNPQTLESLISSKLSGVQLDIEEIQDISQRAILKTPQSILLQDGHLLNLTLSDTYADLYQSINDPNNSFSGFNFINYDFRSIEKSTGSFSLLNTLDIDLTDGVRTSKLVDNSPNLQGWVNLDSTTGDDLFGMTPGAQIQIIVTFDFNSNESIGPMKRMPIVVDLVSFGYENNGGSHSSRIANQILRFELEESGDSNVPFFGTLEFLMLNQLNILNPQTYQNLKPISDNPILIVIDEMEDPDSVKINYSDLISSGVPVTISDSIPVSTQSGSASFDSLTYSKGDTATITLNDLDLNVDSSFIDVYTVVSNSTDPAFDAIGEQNLPVYGYGPLGAMFRIFYDNSQWTTPTPGSDCSDELLPLLVSESSGLGDSGFALIETNSTSGIFIGDFQIPSYWCKSDNVSVTSTDDILMKAKYLDFRNSNGAIMGQNDYSIVSNIFNQCTVPTSGNWILSSNCMLLENAVIPQNLVVQNNSVLIIPTGFTLTISSGNNITIESGGGVLIKSGGSLNILS